MPLLNQTTFVMLYGFIPLLWILQTQRTSPCVFRLSSRREPATVFCFFDPQAATVESRRLGPLRFCCYFQSAISRFDQASSPSARTLSTSVRHNFCFPKKIMEPGGIEERNMETEAIMETQYSHFPDEIILRILSMLPVKSLLRFKCVSKHWSFLISDPDFKLSVQRQEVVIVPTSYELHHSIRMIDDEALVMEVPKALVDIKSIRGVRIRGSCNGFLLFNADNESFLWNPMTRCSKKVLSHERMSNFYGDDTISGLCYDSSADDYKAVMAFTDLDSMSSKDKIVMAGSFKDKIWTEIRFPYNK